VIEDLAHEPRAPREIFRHYLRDLVSGANDGIITTFAVAAGVAGAQLGARTVLILGFANLLADGFSTSGDFGGRRGRSCPRSVGLAARVPLSDWSCRRPREC
jgi:hypothetical protein